MRSLLGALIASLTLVAAAKAQPDHLTCYKVKDPQARASYTAEVGGPFTSLDPGCTIKVPAAMACFPVYKMNVNPTPPGTGGSSGEPNSFGCYKVKCPRVTFPPRIPLNDQFGTRSVTLSAPKLLCAPASPPSGPTTTSSATTTSTTTSTAPPCCTGVPISCTNFAFQTTCQAQSGCTWNAGANVCTGTASACGTFSTQSTCAAQSGCGWTCP